VNWWFRAITKGAIDSELCVNGQMTNENYKLFRINDSDSSLTIKSVTMDNGGMYTCGENKGFGDRHATWLTVSGEREWLCNTCLNWL